jgi:hypothetical protein
MNVQHILIAAVSAFLLSVPAITLAQEKIPAAIESVTVSIAGESEKTGRLDFKSAELEFLQNNEEQAKKDIPQHWQTGLQESISKMAVFQDDAAMKVNLSVRILKLDVNLKGLAVGGPSADTEARYELTDRKYGDLILTLNITATGAAGMSYSLNHYQCVRESVNRAIQDNIARFLEILKTGDAKQSISKSIALAEEARQRKQADVAQTATEAMEQSRLNAIREAEVAIKTKQVAQQQAKQDRLDAIKSKRDAEKQAKQDKLDEIKAKREEKRQAKIRLTEERRIAKEGDGSADDITCKGKGYRPSSQRYINCRSEIDFQVKQLAEQQQAAQKAARVVADQKALADFNKFKDCVEKTKSPACMNNVGVAAFNMGNMEVARYWYTLAARYGQIDAVLNLKRLGVPVPEPDLLQQQQRQQQLQEEQQAQEQGGWSELFKYVILGAAANKYGANPVASSKLPTPNSSVEQAPSYGVTNNSTGANGNIGYKSATGTSYQYDLSKPADQNLYSVDPAAQVRDSINVNPAVNIDRGMGQVGGGVKQ